METYEPTYFLKEKNSRKTLFSPFKQKQKEPFQSMMKPDKRKKILIENDKIFIDTFGLTIRIHKDKKLEYLREYQNQRKNNLLRKKTK
jgi:hypothetical protein